MPNMTHLHVHSQQSIMDGLCSPEELVKTAKDLGQTAIAITDHGTLSGHRALQRAAKEHGIKPILGVEAYFSPTDRFDKRDSKKRSEDNTQVYNHLIVIAKNANGVTNLQKLSELAWTEGYYYKPRMDFEILSDYGDDLIILSGCMSGVISKAIENDDKATARQWARRFKNRFGDDFYIEIQAHNPEKLNRGLLEIADELDIKPLITSDCHYATVDQRAIEEALLILSTTKSSDKPKELNYAGTREMKNWIEKFNYLWPNRPISFKDIEVYVNTATDLADLMEDSGMDREELYTNTIEVTEKIGEYEYHENLDLLPIPVADPDAQLSADCFEGLRHLGIFDNPDYVMRLQEELTLVKKKKFSSYFLIVADIIGFCRSNDIMTGPGRGSAAGSLICYALGITLVDPIKYNLLFSRFMSEGRNDWPDIDFDIEDRRRKEVKDYLNRKYGHMASIATYSFYKDNGVVRDAARVFGVPLTEVNKALKPVVKFEDFENSKSTEEFRMKYPEVLPLAKGLRGTIRATGLHPSGIVVSREPIYKYAPIESRTDPKSTDKERIPVIACDMNETAAIGFIKIDALGLKALSICKDTVVAVSEKTGDKINLTSLELNDPEVFADISAGHTRALFQAEQAASTSLIKKMGIQDFDELVVSNAMVRPGAANTVGQMYIDRKQGKELVPQVHPIYDKITEDTFGVAIYQEQVMLLCVELAGMSWSDADRVRSIIGKKKDVREFDAYRDKFVQGASKNIPVDKAMSLWTSFEAHAEYSFNKSHAVAYSMITYWTAWLKHYYPLEFMAAVLSNEGEDDALTEYFIEIKRMGIPLVLPHINTSEARFVVRDGKIHYGLGHIKFCSEKVASAIKRNGPFNSFREFEQFVNAKGSGPNARTLAALDAVGAVAFDDNKPTGEESNNYYEYLKVPKFDMSKIPDYIVEGVDTLDNFDEEKSHFFLAMAKKIKRGKGWSRIDLLDATGTIGVFHGEHTQIEVGQMYLILVANNRIARYMTVDAIAEAVDNPMVEFLKGKAKLSTGEYYVLSFDALKSKAGNNYAHVTLANDKGEVRKIMAFSSNFLSAMSIARPGAVINATFAQTNDGSLFIKDLSRVGN